DRVATTGARHHANAVRFIELSGQGISIVDIPGCPRNARVNRRMVDAKIDFCNEITFKRASDIKDVRILWVKAEVIAPPKILKPLTVPTWTRRRSSSGTVRSVLSRLSWLRSALKPKTVVTVPSQVYFEIRPFSSAP